MQDFNEDIIIRNLQNKDSQEKAFAMLVNEYSERLYWNIRKIVISHDDAHDILQNVFIKAWTNISNFRGDSKLLTWLYKISVNESITFVNKQRQYHNLTLDDDSLLISKLESDPYFDGDAAQINLQKAILSLPEKQRIVFNMKYFDEMKYDDMSVILDTSVGALKASYHHAVKKIENFLATLD